MSEQEQNATQACTVTQALNAAKKGLEQIRLTMVGEVSEFSNKAGYKAVYFTLRDEESACPCMMWRNVFDASGVPLEQGALVQVSGMFSCYAAKGRMQFQVRGLELAGEGVLRMRVAAVARKLQAEGLMDESRKRRPPALPQRIGIITSPRGKAIRDCLRTLRNCYPLGEVLVYGVPVEGAQAVPSMVEALRVAQASDPAPDVILLVRGGGSYEDLMPFNDESLARAVAACSIPVISGIGHEPDNTIADMVADVRRSTPTYAAQAAALPVDQLRLKLRNATAQLNAAVDQRMENLQHRLDRIMDRPLWRDPYVLTGAYGQALDMAQERLRLALPQTFEARQLALDGLQQRLNRALPQTLAASEAAVASLKQRLKSTGRTFTASQEKSVALAAAKLDALSPLKTLTRGYAVAYEEGGAHVVKSVHQVKPGQEISLRVQDGRLACEVKEIEEKEQQHG